MIEILVHTTDGRLVSSDPLKRLGQRIAYKSGIHYRGGTITEEALAEYGSESDRSLRVGIKSVDPIWALWDGFYVGPTFYKPTMSWMDRGTVMLVEDLPDDAIISIDQR